MGFAARIDFFFLIFFFLTVSSRCFFPAWQKLAEKIMSNEPYGPEAPDGSEPGSCNWL